MIRAELRGTDERAARALHILYPRLIAALMVKMNSLLIQLQAKIVGEKLSGQVLKHRTGKLAGSIRVIAAEASGDKIEGAVLGGGGPAFYAKFHEFGTTDWYVIQPVNKKALRFMIGDKEVFAKSVFHPPIQERSFMRSSLAEMREQVIAELTEIVEGVIGAR
jgi:hypothetical protein